MLCLGLVASDFLTPTAFPVPANRKVRVDRLIRQGGGPAANAAVTLARLGARVAFAGAVGADAIGEEQLAELSAEGVDVSSAASVEGAPSFLSFILVDEESGERTIFSAPQGRPLLPEPPWPRETPHLVLVDGWAGPVQRAVADRARRVGIPVLLDAGSYREEVTEMLSRADVVIGSEPFAEGLVPGKGPEAAVAALLERDVRLAAITRGERGVVAGAAQTSGLFEIPALGGPIVDTTGAGDAFHGAAAFGLARGWSWQEALRLATVVAGLKCGEMGARAGLPVLAAAEAALARLTGSG